MSILVKTVYNRFDKHTQSRTPDVCVVKNVFIGIAIAIKWQIRQFKMQFDSVK